MICERCQERYAVSNDYNFCNRCLKHFKRMIEEMRLAFIHHYMHPDKKTIYVHDDSRRYNVKGLLQTKNTD